MFLIHKGGASHGTLRPVRAFPFGCSFFFLSFNFLFSICYALLSCLNINLICPIKSLKKKKKKKKYTKAIGYRREPIKNRGKMLVTLTSAMCLEHLKNFCPRSNKKNSSVMSCKNNSSNSSSESPISTLAAILKRLFSRPQSTASHLLARTRSFHRPVSFRPNQNRYFFLGIS